MPKPEIKNDGFITTQYDKGIKTMRMYKSKLNEMHEFKDLDSQASDKEDDDPEDSLFRNSVDDGIYEGTQLNHNFNDTFNNRRALNAVISSQIVP